jgi:hypothetical protein
MLRMLACPPCRRRREWPTRGGGSRLKDFQKLIRGSRLAASTMDKSDLVIFWRGRRELVPSSAPRVGGTLSAGGRTPPTSCDSPVCFRQVSDFAGPRLRMPLSFASGSVRIGQVRAGCPSLSCTREAAERGLSQSSASDHPPGPPRRFAYLKLLKTTGNALGACQR